MSSRSRADLQIFVVECIQSVGGIVEIPEYGLAEVLLPEAVAKTFEGRTFLRIAFDPEVAQEHPDAELAVYGSEFLDRLVGLAAERGLATVRHVHIERLEVTRVVERLQDQFHFVSCRPVFDHSEIRNFGYLNFHFKLVYLTDEREESFQSIMVNLNTNRPVKNSERLLQIMAYTAFPKTVYPETRFCSVQTAYQTACVFLRQTAEQAFRAKQKDNRRQLEIDLQRIHTYYDDLKEEAERRMQRTSNSDRADTLLHHLQVYEVERERRKKELEDKYSLRINGRLVGAELIVQLKVVNFVRVFHRDRSFTVQFVWDPLLKTFESPLCERCGEELWTLAFDREGQIACWGKGMGSER